MKTIFLDIDGVILPEGTFKRGVRTFLRNPNDHLDVLAKSTPVAPVTHLTTLAETTGARFVLTSSWRGLFPPDFIQDYLARLGLWPYYFHSDWAVPMRGFPPKPSKARDIGVWLVRHRTPQRDCLVIDDHDLELRKHRFRVLQQLQPMPEVGFSRLDLHRALIMMGHPVSYAEQVLTPSSASA